MPGGKGLRVCHPVYVENENEADTLEVVLRMLFKNTYHTVI